jgi:hypothetical protein
MRISWVGNVDDGRIALFSGWRFSEHGILQFFRIIGWTIPHSP